MQRPKLKSPNQPRSPKRNLLSFPLKKKDVLNTRSILFLLPAISFVVSFVCYSQWRVGHEFESPLYFIHFGICVFNILWWGIITQIKNLSRSATLHILVALISGSFLIESVLNSLSPLVWFWPPHLYDLSAAIVFLLGWNFTDAITDKLTLKPPSISVSEARYLKQQQKIIFFAAACLFVAGWWIVPDLKSPSIWMACFLPVFIPFARWNLWRLHLLALERGLHFNSFSAFQHLRKVNLFIFHYSGALSRGSLRSHESWLEESDLWNAAEIYGVLHALSEHTKHPLLQACLSAFPKPEKQDSVILDKVHLSEHLGLEGTFIDSRRQKSTVHLGGLSWQKCLQHEMSPEGLETIKPWVKQGRHLILLSLNRQIVAAFSFEDPLRNDVEESLEDLNHLQVPIVLLSSHTPSAQMVESRIDRFFKDISMGLFPSERAAQRLRWKERASKAYEVLSSWDEFDRDLAVGAFRYTENPEAMIEEDVLPIESQNLSVIPWALCESKALFRFSIVMPLVTLFAISLFLAATKFGASLLLSLGGFLVFYLVGWRILSLSRR